MKTSTIKNPSITITSSNNPLIKRFRSFKGKLPSKNNSFFCVEGTHLIEESIRAGINLSTIIATEEWIFKNQSLIDNLNHELINSVSKEALSSAVSTKNPDGVAALVKISELNNKYHDVKGDFILILDRIQDPGNLGTIFRIALAAGVNKVLLAGGANPFNQKVIRASCGSIFHLPFMRIEGNEKEIIEELLKSLKDISRHGFKVVTTEASKRSTKQSLKPYWELNWSEPIAVLLGNEGSGVHNKVKDAFHEAITIPHSELVESLNVACVAVPILLERKRAALTSKIKNRK